MKLPKAYLDYIDKITSLLQARMLLMDFDIKVRNKVVIAGSRYVGGYSAEMDVDTRYMQIDINLSGKFYQKWKVQDYRGMVAVMCHELAHVYTDPYYEFFFTFLPKKFHKQLEHLNEQQTERLSRVFMLNIKPKDYLP